MEVNLDNFKNLGVYVHIPFCKKKCYYCDFISFAEKGDLHKKYIDALTKEINQFLKSNPECKISTIYIGGGTPSCIDSKYIGKIMNLFNKENLLEATIEVNPGTVTKEKLQNYKKARVK